MKVTNLYGTFFSKYGDFYITLNTVMDVSIYDGAKRAIPRIEPTEKAVVLTYSGLNRYLTPSEFRVCIKHRTLVVI
jgi:hypothetical protein